MPDSQFVNALRTGVGQGMGMGWGDEGEAWLRSKLGDEDYETSLKKIRNELAQYHKESPFVAGATELAGGIIPGAAAMMIPGMQPMGAALLARTGMSNVGRLTALGAGSGAMSGAGSSTEDNRGSGAVGGVILGGAMGATVPIAMRGTSAGAQWLKNKLFDTQKGATNRAADILNRSVAQSQMTPADVAAKMAQDHAMGVPSMIANASPRVATQARGVVKRAGEGSQEIEDALIAQKAGSRERTYGQVRKELHPGDYYADEQKLVDELRQKASTLYDQAYAHGSVDDPRINTVLKHPEFANFFAKAQKIAKTEAMAAKLRGEDPAKYELQDLYKLVLDPQTQQLTPVISRLPDVRTLDYMKRGIDATIDSGFRGEGMSTAEAQALKQLRREFVTAIDDNVPLYKSARKSYAGDMETIDAIRSGMNDFNKLDHEEVTKLVAGMSQAEKEAFRTGVARNLYSKIMDSATNRNSAQNIIGSPEYQAKLQPLFDSPGQFELFKNALERESQLFTQASRALGGSDTAENIALREGIEGGGQGFGQFVAQSVTGGFTNSLSNAALRVINQTSLGDNTAKKLANMLIAKDPAEVATVVKILEDRAKNAKPKAYAFGVAEAGATTGATSSFWPAPMESEEP